MMFEFGQRRQDLVLMVYLSQTGGFLLTACVGGALLEAGVQLPKHHLAISQLMILAVQVVWYPIHIRKAEIPRFEHRTWLFIVTVLGTVLALVCDLMGLRLASIGIQALYPIPLSIALIVYLGKMGPIRDEIVRAIASSERYLDYARKRLEELSAEREPPPPAEKLSDLQRERDRQLDEVMNSGREPALVVAQIRHIQEEYQRRVAGGE